ncbi:MAG: hypothetical protein U0736_05720 [Gemmataceae bacterium]
MLWPALLLEDEFADRRGRVEELLKDGRSLAAKGEPAAGAQGAARPDRRTGKAR